MEYVEESKETIGNLNQELLAYREQNDRLQKRCEELEGDLKATHQYIKGAEEENKRLKEELKVKGLTVNVKIADFDTVKQYLDYLKGAIEVALNGPIELMDYDTFKQKTS
jgi:predicted nuclease with TOPRIM domain